MFKKQKRLFNLFRFSKRLIADFDPRKDYYKLLGLNKNATDKEIKTAYYKLAKQYHPDVNQGKNSELFKEITAAYDVLSDENKRRQYDNSRTFNFWDSSNRQTYSNNTNYNYSSSKSNQNYQNYQYDNFSKNFNDFFKNWNKFYENKDNEDFYKKKYSDFYKKYYEKNKDYYSSFKRKEGEQQSNEYEAGQEQNYHQQESESFKDKYQRSKKGKTDFRKSHFEKNKAYFDSFKQKKGNTNDEKVNNFLFIMFTGFTFFGLFLFLANHRSKPAGNNARSIEPTKQYTISGNLKNDENKKTIERDNNLSKTTTAMPTSPAKVSSYQPITRGRETGFDETNDKAFSYISDKQFTTDTSFKDEVFKDPFSKR